MNEIRIVIPGSVASYQKATFTWRSKDGRSGTSAYNKAGYAKWKDYARLTAAQQMGDRPLFQDAVVATIDVFKDIPQSMSQKKRRFALKGILRPTTKPDMDNQMKAIADSCLTGIVIRDDSLIVSVNLNKWFSDKPRVEIMVKRWDVEGLVSQIERDMFAQK